jgi:hypothetical protein
MKKDMQMVSTMMKEQKDGAKSAEKKSAEGAHDDDEGLIQMDSQRMQAAGIRTAEVGSATVRSVLQLPGNTLQRRQNGSRCPSSPWRRRLGTRQSRAGCKEGAVAGCVEQCGC